MEDNNTLFTQLGIISTSRSIQECFNVDEYYYFYYEDKKYNRWCLSKRDKNDKIILYQDNNIVVENPNYSR
jgi:hypothetical protein